MPVDNYDVVDRDTMEHFNSLNSYTFDNIDICVIIYGAALICGDLLNFKNWNINIQVIGCYLILYIIISYLCKNTVAWKYNLYNKVITLNSYNLNNIFTCMLTQFLFLNFHFIHFIVFISIFASVLYLLCSKQYDK